jgi:hypothetical protein
LSQYQLLGEPLPEFRGQVGAERESGSLAVLLIGGFEVERRGRAIEPELGQRQRRQLPLPQPGQDERLVDQGPLATQAGQVFNGFGSDVCPLFTLVLPAPDQPCLPQRPAGGNRQQPVQFSLRHGPALPAGVGLFVQHRDAGERVAGQPADGFVGTPIAKGVGDDHLTVPRPGAHARSGLSEEPLNEPVAVEVG